MLLTQAGDRSMPAPIRPRRSVLYVPGANARALDKARSLGADGFIFDLEDAVAPDAKDLARDQVIQAVTAGGYGGREILLRVNSLTTEWGHTDLAAAANLAIDGVLLPKVESANMVHEAIAVLTDAGTAAPAIIWCMLETPLGVLRAEEIAKASPRVGGMIMGTSDLANDLHAATVPGRAPLLPALAHCLLVARAHGLPLLDGVHLDLADDAAFLAECRQGQELGFDGKTLIHPKTIPPANQVFAPSPEQVDWSRRIILAHARADAAGKGIVLVDGKLIENLHVANAHRIVTLAETIAALEGSPSA
jgi:citrate lyase subunit beta / citryl-CoA lyase